MALRGTSVPVSGRRGRSLAALAALLAASLVAGPGDARAGDRMEAARKAFAAGLAFDLGQGGAPDPLRARQEYQIAATAGLPEAEFNLAVMLDSGIGIGVDRQSAAVWYARAASHGFGRAAFDLAELIERGDGVPENPVLAGDWFHVAAEEGIEAARQHRAPDEPGHEALAPPIPLPAQVDQSDQPRTIPVELVWTVPSMPRDGRFYLEVTALGPGSTRRDVVWQESPVSAALVEIPSEAGRYAWRVLLASASSGHYVSSDWRSFPISASDRTTPAGPA